jgi:acetyl esterase/lipase
MSASPDFKKLFADIGQDYDWPRNNPEKLRDGGRFYRDVPYAAPWGFRPLLLNLSVPKGKGPHPVIVFIHGGAWAMGHPTITNPVYRKMDFLNRFHKAGFAVARIAYRLSHEAKFPTQLHDCKAAVRYLRKHAKLLGIDPKRFASFGDSAGGHLAALVGLTGHNKKLEGKVGETEGSSAVQSVVNWFGPTEFLTMAKQKRKLHSRETRTRQVLLSQSLWAAHCRRTRPKPVPHLQSPMPANQHPRCCCNMEIETASYPLNRARHSTIP